MALCITRKAVESEFGVTTFTLVHVEVNRSRFRLRRARELLTHTQMDFLNPAILNKRLDELSLVAERRRETPPQVALPRDLDR
jgi:hypothetical protein